MLDFRPTFLTRPMAALAGYVLLACALVGVLTLTIGFVPALFAGVSLLVGAMLPGAAVVRLLLPRATLFHFIILGTIVGLGFWAAGGLLSHLTGLYVVRWVPSAIGLALWAVGWRRRSERLPLTARIFPAAALVGATVALIALIPAVRTILSSQPANWSGWVSLYPDLGFQVAIASEAAAHVPQYAPWVAGTPLSYTWTFHSAMGVWSSTSGVSPADLVLQVWPVLFAILMPGMMSIVAWELSRKLSVAVLAPVVFVLAHGLLFAPSSFVQLPIEPLSPTRDFGDLFLLVVILSLNRLFGRGSIRALSWKWLVVLFFSMIIATGAKGSELPVLLGGVLSVLAVLVIRRRAALSDFVAAAVFALGGIVGYLIVIPDSGIAQSLSWGPLTFLAEGTPHRALLSIVLLVLLAGAIIAFWVTIGTRAGWVVSTILAGTMFAGLLGLGLLTQSGSSQNYFWQATEPIIAIAIAWCAIILYQGYRRSALIAAAMVFFGVTVLSAMTQNPLIVAAGIAVLAVAAAIVLAVVKPRDARWPARIARVAIVALLLTQSAQIIGVSPGQIGGEKSQADDSSAVNGTQLAAFNFIRSNSSPSDLVATNVHCRTGSMSAGDCDPREFMVAAITERRVLVEGWAYTQYGSSPGWVKTQLALSDNFVDSPTTQEKQKLVNLGVRYVYIDTRQHYSNRLGSFADLVFKSKWARVYEFDGTHQ